MYPKMLGFAPVNGGQYTVPTGVGAVYFNISSLFGYETNITLVEAFHNNPVLTRTAIITKSHQLLVVSFHNNQTRDVVILLSNLIFMQMQVTINITAFSHTSGQLFRAFNVSAETRKFVPPVNVTNSTTSPSTKKRPVGNALQLYFLLI